jgi:ribosome-binding ATPase YchF (GTP1/OBG family)
VIHSDLEKGFISAEVMRYDDFVKHGGSEESVKAAGLYLTKGRDAVIGDGDIVYFKTRAMKR